MLNHVTSDTVVEVRDLIGHYDERKILDGVSLSISKQEIFVIMGGSGAGKSTLLGHILGLRKASSGNIFLLGNEITHASKKELYKIRKNIGVAFQGGALISSMTVADNIELPLKEHTRLDKNTIAIMSRMKLALMNLAGTEGLMPSQLSGGMLKRAGLARAVIMDPALLFFDEPSAGLDPINSAELDELILQLRDAMNMTIVVVTHELESAFKIADRIALLDAGKLIFTGSAEEMRESNNPRVQDFLNRKPRHQSVDASDYLERLTGNSQ